MSSIKVCFQERQTVNGTTAEKMDADAVIPANNAKADVSLAAEIVEVL